MSLEVKKIGKVEEAKKPSHPKRAKLQVNPRSKQYDKKLAKRRAKEKNRRLAARKQRARK